MEDKASYSTKPDQQLSLKRAYTKPKRWNMGNVSKDRLTT